MLGLAAGSVSGRFGDTGLGYGSRPDTATVRCWTIDYGRFSGRAPGYDCLPHREGFTGHSRMINSRPNPAPRLVGWTLTTKALAFAVRVRARQP